MKKNLIFVLMFVVVLSLSFISSQLLNSSEQQKRVNQAYSCLDSKIKGKCSSLSIEERIFSFLSTGQCRQEMISSSKNGECWPQTTGECKIKTTAQAILSLENNNVDSTKPKNWLLNKTKNPTELVWYLQIDSNEATSCTIGYRGQTYNVNINENKILSNNAGACLIVSENGYWFQISSSCYNEEITISCDKDFLTSLLFKKTTSSTINVLPEVSSASAGGTTREKVESLCFVEGNSCNYEGSLWATLALASLGEETKQYMPYLVALADENPKFLPESFLTYLTGDSSYKAALISKQKESSYWLESGDKFYDTALALYPLQKESLEEVENSKNWLLTNQDRNGCWQDSLKNTAFILFSVWPKKLVSSDGSGVSDCESSGFYCTTIAGCEGEILSEYSCPSSYQCCNKQPVQTTCSEEGGIVCSQNERCVGGTTLGTPDLRLGESCCIGGSCQEAEEERSLSDCELQGGVCRANSCEENEEEKAFSCNLQSEVCCMIKIKEKKSNLLFWILFILVLLVALGIIFREKLRHYWFKFRDSFGKKKGPPTTPPKYPSTPTQPYPVHRTIEKHYVPVQKKMPLKKTSSHEELDEVLKKLKEMGK
ncbi:MAG: hypothetical protein KatS3mg001_440 [Candidatus Pacearchaeota archaeon]|nr:MAG: hypothetical protein KatS3mg001_440 [Candidatus Pacearchaeota archaeon]